MTKKISSHLKKLNSNQEKEPEPWRCRSLLPSPLPKTLTPSKHWARLSFHCLLSRTIIGTKKVPIVVDLAVTRMAFWVLTPQQALGRIGMAGWEEGTFSIHSSYS